MIYEYRYDSSYDILYNRDGEKIIINITISDDYFTSKLLRKAKKHIL